MIIFLCFRHVTAIDYVLIFSVTLHYYSLLSVFELNKFEETYT